MKVLLPVLALVFSACIRQSSQQIPDQKKSAALYADMLDAAIEARKARLDSAAAAAKTDSVLAAHGTSRQEFLATMEWYNDDVGRWKPFWEEVVRALDERSRESGTQHNARPDAAR